jgi:thiamine pyrophosphate-dependent acetolactate synthase large subunit-like protein
MNLETRKLNLINWITSLQETDLIEKLEALQKEESDWWDDLSEEEKAEIEQGLAEADRGEVIPHEEVMKKYKKWL